MTDELKQDALAFLDEVEKAATDAGYQAAKEEFDAQVSAMKADFDAQIVKTREEYYNIGYSDAQEGTIVGVAILEDGTEYENDKTKQVEIFSYSRKFTTTKWGTIILPISLNYSDWSANFEIAEITGVSVSGDTITPVRKVLGAGLQTLPNVPYLIRAKKADANKAQAITKKNCHLYPSDAGSVEIVKGGKKYTFKGTYINLSSDDLKGKYYSSNGVFVTAKSTCKPMRVILEITE